MAFDKQCGRLRVQVSQDGIRDHGYGHGATISCPTGWNDSCPVVSHVMSMDELRDLHYLLGRAIEEASSSHR